MQKAIRILAVACVCAFSLHLAMAQQPAAQQPAPAQQAAAVAEPEAPRVVLQAETTASVLRLMKFSGALRDRAGNARSDAVGLTFALYKDQQGGSPLWLEVHNVQLDEQGRYTVLLGSTKSEGLPLELFSSGEARWLGVQLNLPGEEEQARVLLVSVPYALKAADAETLGGKPPSAFLLADPVGADLRVRPEAGKEAVKEGPPREGVVGPINGEGTVDSLAKFTGANAIGNAGIVEVSGKVGIGTATPNVKLSLGTDITAQKLALYDGLGDFYGLGVQAGRVVLHTANTERMAITSDGRVGIGTAAPAARLAVTGSGTGDARFGDPGCGGNYTGIWLNQLTTDCTNYNLTSSPGDQTLYINRPAGAGIEFREGNAAQMVVKAGGKVGIGTAAPNVKLSLGTDITAQKLALYDGAGDFYGLGVQGGRIVVHTGNTEKMAITTAGNVGIGTASPTEKLDVAGNTKVSGNLTLSGSMNGGLRVEATAGTPNVIGGFSGNSVTGGGGGATISGGGQSGFPNSVNASFGTVGGGQGNTASDLSATVGGGNTNTASGLRATVGGGLINHASGGDATIGGGGNNNASGFAATVPGGSANTATGNFSLAAGRRAKAIHDGAFVWGDSTNADIASTAANQFVVRASGGARFFASDLHLGTIPTPAFPGSNSLYIENNGGDSNNSFRIDGASDTLYMIASSAAGAATGAGITFRTGLGGAGETDRMLISAGGNVVVNRNLDVLESSSITGNLTVFGTLSKSGGSFRIDHPLDPANKYLSHSFVESPDMMNVYNGNARLDSNGEAWVELPEWFEALNRDFRYQLTALGAPGPNLYIGEKISGNRFKIAGGRAGGEVSWQVTGIRKDVYANAYRIKVEEEKPLAQRGSYLHPELYGQPKERGIGYAHGEPQPPAPRAEASTASAAAAPGRQPR